MRRAISDIARKDKNSAAADTQRCQRRNEGPFRGGALGTAALLRALDALPAETRCQLVPALAGAATHTRAPPPPPPRADPGPLHACSAAGIIASSITLNRRRRPGTRARSHRTLRPSLLPKWQGLDRARRALLSGEPAARDRSRPRVLTSPRKGSPWGTSRRRAHRVHLPETPFRDASSGCLSVVRRGPAVHHVHGARPHGAAAAPLRSRAPPRAPRAPRGELASPWVRASASGGGGLPADA